MSLPSQHERTLRMMEAFMELRAKGLGIKQIAYSFDLDSSTVYRSLDEIAARYNAAHPDAPAVTREDLLVYPQMSRPGATERAYALLPPIDLTNFRKEFAQTVADFNSLLATISGDITTQEELAVHAV